MDAVAAQDIYVKLVHWVANTAAPDWRRAEIYMEIAVENAGVESSWILRCYVGDDERKLSDYPATGSEKIEMRDLFMELSRLSAEDGQRWSACTFNVTNQGRFEVDYTYGEHPLLSGEMLTGPA